MIAGAAYRKRGAGIASATALACAIGPPPKQAAGEVRSFQNSSNQTISLSGLVNPDADCSLLGTGGGIVKCDFGNDALTITGFVIDHADGTRQFVNVVMPTKLSLSARDAAFDGVQRLLQQGRVVSGRTLACGAAGRVPTVESVQ